VGQLTIIVQFAIKPGRLDAFKKASKDLRTVTNEEPGTLRYDWHVSDDGRQGVNIEIFEDADAFVVHERHVRDLVPALGETATVERFHVIGDVNDELRSQLADVATGYFTGIGGIDR
jgi:quinol monooxygenase YgiN